MAPYDVVMSGSKVYVSNWGGRSPDANSITGPAGRGTLVRVDPPPYCRVKVLSPSSILGANRVVTEILMGLHASALASRLPVAATSRRQCRQRYV